MLSYRARVTSYFHVITLFFITLLLGTASFGQQPSPGGPDGPPHQGPGLRAVVVQAARAVRVAAFTSVRRDAGGTTRISSSGSA
jgi:hypothetical protein